MRKRTSSTQLKPNNEPKRSKSIADTKATSASSSSWPVPPIHHDHDLLAINQPEAVNPMGNATTCTDFVIKSNDQSDDKPFPEVGGLACETEQCRVRAIPAEKSREQAEGQKAEKMMSIKNNGKDLDKKHLDKDKDSDKKARAGRVHKVVRQRVRQYCCACRKETGRSMTEGVDVCSTCGHVICPECSLPSVEKQERKRTRDILSS